jgi:arylsulfatase A-like enzyme
MDTLLGEFLDALRAAGRLDRSIVIITGDHGESFWERGVGTHGSDLGPEQLEVAFAMHLPGAKPERFATVFSLLDVMPTVLARLGATPDPAAGLAGRPVQDRLADPSAPGYALTFQGWNTRAFAFAITDGARSVLLELDDCDPTLCRRLAVKDVTLAPGAPTLSEKGDAAAYRSLLGEVPRLVDRLPFLRFE